MDDTTFAFLALFVFVVAMGAFVVFFIKFVGEPNPSAAQLNAPDLPAFPQAPAPGMGMIYVVRPSRMAMAVKYSIRLDNPAAEGEVASLGARQYVAVPASPGAHSLFASTLEKNDEAKFEIAAGQTFAFIARPGFGWILQTARLVPLDERTARFHVSRIPPGKLRAAFS